MRARVPGESFRLAVPARLRGPLVTLISLLSAAAVALSAPGSDPGRAAIGSTAGLSRELQRAFAPEAFAPLPRPGPGDWLAEHPEPGQTCDQFRRSKPLRPEGARRKLYLQPLGTFRAGEAPSLDELRSFAEAFFALDVEVRSPVPLEGVGLTSRRNPMTGNRQLLTGDLLALLGRRLPDDAFAMLGITLEDLYPDPAWNFVFGQASLRDRVGVYSFARYDPSFYGEKPDPDRRRLLLRRSCKVLAHETAHMFGIRHCTFYSCLMNGSNHLAESDARPLHLCPVDLRKLHASVGFDPVARYRRLLAWTEAAGFDDEARWLRQRIAWITRP